MDRNKACYLWIDYLQHQLRLIDTILTKPQLSVEIGIANGQLLFCMQMFFSQQVQTWKNQPTQEKSEGNSTLLGTNIFPPMVVFSKIFLFQERWDGDVLFPGRNWTNSTSQIFTMKDSLRSSYWGIQHILETYFSDSQTPGETGFFGCFWTLEFGNLLWFYKGKSHDLSSQLRTSWFCFHEEYGSWWICCLRCGDHFECSDHGPRDGFGIRHLRMDRAGGVGTLICRTLDSCLD